MKPAGSPWSEGAGPALIYFFFRGGAWLAEHLPISAGNRLASLAANLSYRLSRRRRDIVRKNLSRVVGPGPHLEALVRKAYHSYAEYWLETFRLGRYTPEDLGKLVLAEDKVLRTMDDALAEGRGVLVITAHFGLYDLGCAWMGTEGWPLTTVTEVLKPRALYEWFTALRSKWGVQIVPAERGQLTRRIGKILQNGEVLALVADRDLGRRGIWAEFFGERTTFPATPPLLMARKGIPLLAGAVFTENGRPRAHFERVPYETSGDEAKDIVSCAQVVAHALEGLVLKAPEQWHLFSANWPSDEQGLPPRGSDRNPGRPGSSAPPRAAGDAGRPS